MSTIQQLFTISILCHCCGCWWFLFFLYGSWWGRSENCTNSDKLHSLRSRRSIIEAFCSANICYEAADSILKSNNSTKIFHYIYEPCQSTKWKRVGKSNCIISRECLFAFGRLALLLTNACDSSFLCSLPFIGHCNN